MKLSIKDEWRYRGWKPDPKIITISPELENLYELLKRYEDLPKRNQKAKFCNEIEAGRTFLSEIYKIHNVPWMKVLVWNLIIKGNISPFSLPIKRVKGVNGSLDERLVLDDSPHISYESVKVSRKSTEILSSIYIHEITHTQQNHIPGLIEDYYDLEVLSIFNELLYASFKTERYARLYDTNRLQSTFGDLEFLFNYKDNIEENYDLVKACCYIVSTLKAYHLFYIYYYGNTSTKRHILSMIQKVFDHCITVEECLTSLDISYENSLDIQKLERVLNR